ncbi:MAG: phosphopentomutase [Clostridiales bacterium]
MKRVILIVLDSVGIGALPDAEEFGDKNSNTIGNIYNEIENFELINLEKMGLGNIEGVKFVKPSENPIFSYGKMNEISVGKDTTTGHWEIAGLILNKPFPVYKNGFPKNIIKCFTDEIKRDILGNYAASGTEIINKLGNEHVSSGKPIVYTSADSVFQIAAHEDVIPVKKLYDMCKIAREILKGDNAVGRVIARPFTGSKGNFIRTKNRKDFSLEPFSDTVLDILYKNGLEVNTIGKIGDIFAHRSISNQIKTKNNLDGINKIIESIKKDFNGILFANLIDFDMLYGHRNDVKGYGNALKEFDSHIMDIKNNLKDDDLLIITADHGCDPTIKGTDHTREYVPLFVYSKIHKNNYNLGIRNTFSDIAKTICDYFELSNNFPGESFIKNIDI